jgi:exodeoxyribonuclease V beta subunit
MSKIKTIVSFDPMRVGLEQTNLIEASAGTGKTYSIAILGLRLLLEKQIPIQKILMVTFTKAAVAELETRIRQFVRSALRYSQGTPILDDTIASIVSASNVAVGPLETGRLLKEAVLFLDETSILTIHSFCQRVLTEFAFETKQVFGSEIITDLRALITDHVNEFWRKYITTLNLPLLKELAGGGFSREKLIRLVESSLSGSSILRMGELPADFLSHRHQAEAAATILGFSKRSEEVRSGIFEYMKQNIVALREVTGRNKHATKNFGHLLENPEVMLDAILAARKKKTVYVDTCYPWIVEECGKMDSINEEKKQALDIIINQLHDFAIGIISGRVARHKEELNQLGFDDMINKLYQALLVDRNQFLITSLREKYKAAFIDEFQDTDKMQYEIFNCLFGHHSILFYIGDPKQSIYAWRKADIFTYFKAASEVANRFGMNTNYRSSRSYIDGMNKFFLPEPGFDSFYFSGQSNAIEYIPVKAPALAADRQFYKRGEPDAPFTIFDNRTNDMISESVVAQIIQLLATSEYTIGDNGRQRPVRPSDIGILVRKNKQAASIKKLLSRYCIPAITIDDSKLMQSGEAVHVLYLLEAVIDISAAAINKALLTPLTGYTTAQILQLDDEISLNRFKNYQQLWEHEGVYVMLAKFLADYRVKHVLLNETTENGERIITNVLQLMELLHKTQTQKQFSPLELTDWFKRGMEGMQVEGDEFEQRVESDEEAIKIVTIHKSKGLQYNIVFAPFLDLVAKTDGELVSFRDSTSGDYFFSDPELLTAEQKLAADTQSEQENRRLVYVCITRAVYKCYISRNSQSKFNDSALAVFVTALKQKPSPLVRFEPVAVLPAAYRYTSTKEQFRPAYLQAANFALSEANWRRMSYTYLDPEHAIVSRANPPKSVDGYDEFIFRMLRRGTNTGNLLHYIFERIDFMDPAYWPKLIGDGLKRFISNPPAEYHSKLLELLQHVTQNKINIHGTAFTLAEVQKEKRISEMEFDFPVAPFAPEEVNRLSSSRVPLQVRYARELEGMMNGKIDMFFEHAGKYFILDWKSNFLGYRPGDYSLENISLAMEESNYHLQYLIYTIAARKYLQLRLPGFDYAKQFGGVIYLFVRGVRKDREQGVFTTLPEEALLDKLEALLGVQSI